MKITVEQLLQFAIENAELICSRRRTSAVFVKNEAFPTGAYRIHINEVLPPMILFSRGYAEYVMDSVLNYDSVEFDRSSLWLTIYLK